MLAQVLARARLVRGKVLGAAQLLDPNLTLEAVVAILVENGVTTSAIEGERLDLDAVRSSVARHLGLPTSGLSALPRAVDGLIDALLDATRHHEIPLTTERQPTRFFNLSAQILRERDSYYATLERTQRGSVDVTDWLGWFLTQVEASATAAERTLANTLAKGAIQAASPGRRLERASTQGTHHLLDAGPGGFEGGINTRKYMSLTKISRGTVYRELTDLFGKGCLAPTGKGGRSSGYLVVW